MWHVSESREVIIIRTCGKKLQKMEKVHNDTVIGNKTLRRQILNNAIFMFSKKWDLILKSRDKVKSSNCDYIYWHLYTVYTAKRHTLKRTKCICLYSYLIMKLNRNTDLRLFFLPHTLSPVMANGALNHCSKVLQLLKIVGRRKLSRAQSSGSLFCSGVPVSSRRRGAT